MKIAVAGLGLIGGSFYKAALRASHDAVGLHHGDAHGMEDADIVLVCLPPAAIAPWIRAHAPQFKDGALVVDIGGVKRVVAAAVGGGGGDGEVTSDQSPVTSERLPVTSFSAALQATGHGSLITGHGPGPQATGHGSPVTGHGPGPQATGHWSPVTGHGPGPQATGHWSPVTGHGPGPQATGHWSLITGHGPGPGPAPAPARRWRFVGGHPMAGREVTGYANSTADLFDGASMILTPAPDTPEADLRTLRAFFASVGFRETVLTTPERHDELIAFTSQLCHVVATTFARDPLTAESAGFTAGSFADMTRVATQDADVWSALYAENRDMLLAVIDRFRDRLDEFRSALAVGDDEAVRRMIREGTSAKREELLCRKRKEREA